MFMKNNLPACCWILAFYLATLCQPRHEAIAFGLQQAARAFGIISPCCKKNIISPVHPSPSTRQLGALACALYCGAALASELPEVTVAGIASDAQLSVLDHRLLQEQPDASLQDILLRQPGIALDSDGKLSLRGMGSGMTQVLLDGRPLGTFNGGGASLEDVPAALIESVEIVRGASAEDSGAGIAGTIRVHLRRAGGTPERSVRARLGFSPQGQFERSTALALGGQGDMLDWQFNAQVLDKSQRIRKHNTTSNSSRQWDVWFQDVITVDRLSEERTTLLTRTRQTSLAGEVALHPTSQDRITLQWMGEYLTLRQDSATTTARPYFVREYSELGWMQLPAVTRSSSNRESPHWTIRPTLRWEHATADGGQVQAEAGMLQSRNHSSYAYQGTSDSYAWGGQESTLEHQRELHGALRWKQPLGHGMRLTLGTQLRNERMRETITEDGDTDTSSVMRRAAAAFAQWNWQPGAAWDLEAGLRRERNQIRFPADAGMPHRNDDFWLPSLNLRYRPNDLQQWHAGLARTYRSPRLSLLLPRINSGHEGSIGDPDIAGNPRLRSELATGLELGFSQQLQRNGRNTGEWSANVFARSIANSLANELDTYRNEEGDTRWLLTAVNRQRTEVLGLELAARHDLAQLPVSLNAHLTLARSRVSGQTAPARLQGQSPAVLDWGFSVRHPGGSLLPDTWNVLMRHEAGYSTRANAGLIMDIKPLSTLNLQALWKLEPTVRLRAQLAQLGNDWKADARSTVDGTRIRMRSQRPLSVALMLEKDI